MNLTDYDTYEKKTDTEQRIQKLNMDEGLFISKKGACLLETFDDGNKVIPFKRESFIGLNEYVERLMRKLNMTTDRDNELLPPNCRFSFENKKGRVLVIEEPPSVRTIRVNISMDVEISKLERQGKLDLYGYREYLTKNPKGPWKVTLSFPYIVYVISLHRESGGFTYTNIKAFFRVTPLSSIQDTLLYPNLLNTNKQCTMCIKGREAEQETPKLLHNVERLSDKVLGILERVWRYEYNLDYNDCNKLYNNVADVSSILEWEYNTKKDPMFIYSVDWLGYPTNLVDVINKILGDDLDTDQEKHIQTLYDTLKDSCVYDRVIDNGNLRQVVSSFADEVDLLYMIDNAESEENCATDENISDESEVYTSTRISVGDELLYKGKKIWINGFIFTEKAGVVETQILAEDENRKKEKIKLTKTVAKLFLKQVSKRKIEAVQTNNDKVSAGDLLLLTDPLPLIKRVIDVRISRDNEPEAHLDGGHYLLNHIKHEKINEKDFSASGLRFIAGQEYIVDEDRICRHPQIYYASRGTYKNIDNKTNIVFVRNDGSEYRISLNERLSNISKIDSLIDTSYAFIGTSLLDGEDNRFLIDREKKKMLNVVKRRSDFGRKLINTSSSFNNIFPRLFNGNTVTIPGIDRDISFSVGDKVIIADRINSNRMKKISTITNIIIEKSNDIPRKLKFELTNPTEVFTQTFIDFSTGVILAGYIRKVVEEWNGIKAGMFFDPKNRLHGFFRNKRAVISAIMVDTGCNIPMFLCSNFNTIWATENNLSLFEIGNTRRKSPETEFPPEYEKMQAFDNMLVKDYSTSRGGHLRTNFFHCCINLNTRGYNYMESIPEISVEPTDFSMASVNMTGAERYISGVKYGILPPRKHFTRQYFGDKLVTDLFGWYFNDEDISKDIISQEIQDSEEIERENQNV